MTKLRDSAGCGNKILENWEYFKYELKEQTSLSDGTSYSFDVSFGNQNGYMSVVIKKDLVSQDTLLQLDGFDRPLGAYNDTVGFTDGLYEVGKRMIETLEAYKK